MEVFAFYVFAAIAVIASLLVVGQRNPMHSVMLLITSFGALAGLYVLLDAPFTAVTQIIIYAGAIMVLFLFVVMLLNVPREEPLPSAIAGLLGPSGMRLGARAVGAPRGRGAVGAVAAGAGHVLARARRLGELGRQHRHGCSSPSTRSRSRSPRS